ncbi:uncharacterized protein TRUGW13939_03194 [Talaromyces rugulosus]|uniref:FAD-binding domain-containing protein n=1 Tax=Talaromyces rugulosus TaxID=121627 RepID=A0A7H8QQ62_TALRU|nr:uncharacterized protein TRUGW13939_03194 [Talaromyces rugulosus]QKX56094.1 hypothetical protein TRUGW13939_03194 [Talaromyces rugulosus]
MLTSNVSHRERTWFKLNANTTVDEFTVAIIRGGIGGLALAISCVRRGIKVNSEDYYELLFVNCSSDTASLVIGCDGVKSRTRQLVLDENDAVSPQFSGKYAYRGLVPMDDAVVALAHPSTPHQGAGARQAIEDALVLSELLRTWCDSSPSSGVPVEKVIAAYDAVRRPRSQKLVTTSRATGMMYDWEHPDCGSNLDKVRAYSLERFSWTWDEDLDEQIRVAVDMAS